MRHLDLFSGIGGFALAARTVWGNEYENVGFCDNNRFCQAVIRKNFPGARICGDIRELTPEWLASDSERLRKLQQEGRKQDERERSINGIDLVTGGFPCQPFSCAGRRKGTQDDRHLWPEMFRVVKIFQPRWVVAENVRGLLSIGNGMVFEQVCLDMEAAGYEVRAFVIPAVAVNAPHRRDRVWIVANRNCEYGKKHIGRNKLRQEREKGSSGWVFSQSDWEKDWVEAATEFCGIYDGLPAELDELKLSAAGHMRERLKSLGNAIVPQVAVEIMSAIKAADACM